MTHEIFFSSQEITDWCTHSEDPNVVWYGTLKLGIAKLEEVWVEVKLKISHLDLRRFLREMNLEVFNILELPLFG